MPCARSESVSKQARGASASLRGCDCKSRRRFAESSRHCKIPEMSCDDRRTRNRKRSGLGETRRGQSVRTSEFQSENHFGIFTDEVITKMRVFLEGALKIEEVGIAMGLALGNLAVAQANHVHIADCGCLKPLIWLLSSPRPECQFYAARAIFRLARHAQRIKSNS